jgi:hypothetical protein
MEIALTPEQFAARRAAIRAMGMSMGDGNQGVLKAYGVTAEYCYDGAAMLEVTVKPAFFESKILAWFAEEV